jgi:class 3 adenylate cyclase/tetratricopeptide (TPR) repeat protein
MDFYAVLDQVLALLRQRGRVSYRALKRQFDLDDAYLDDLKVEIIEVQQCARDQEGTMLVWTSEVAPAIPEPVQAPAPLAYTPPYLAEKILTSRSALEGERKQVTVLFADLKGSTELIQGLDPEEARRLLDPALHVMMDAVHRYEGTVNQVLGDGIMALFGAPLAHEDHAARACYAALAMQTALRRYADEVRRTQGLLVQMRVGLNSGVVVVRAIGNDLHMDYSAVGETTHLAARMEQLAAPGSIMLTTATLRLVEGFVQVQALGPVPVKGLVHPVEIFELVGASTIHRRLQASAVRGLTRFVGRQQELMTLQQALERGGAGHGQVVALVGEAGVGKSRLVYEFIHSHHTPGWLVLESASVSYGKTTPYFPIIDLLKRYSHVEEHDNARTIRAKVTGQVLTLDAALQDAIPPLLALLDALPDDSPFHHLDPVQRRQRTLAALKRVLLRESQVQPLVLVYEDLHWIDAETQALLDSLVESLPTTQILLLVNYRPEYQHGWGSKTYYTQLRLDPLPPASAAEVLQALLGDDPSLTPLKPLLIARTEGNPFFLEESVRTLVETGVLMGTPGAYRLAQPLQSIQVPATVQAVLAARIDRLPSVEKRLLQTAAVIGTEVPFPLLTAVAELPDADLRRGLTHLQAAEFLYETRLFPEPEYTFKHALTHEVAYSGLLQERRRTLHATIVEALEGLYAERLTEQVERLAHHTVRAGVWDKALAYCRQAGAKATAQAAYRGAVAAFEQALVTLQHLPESRDLLEQAIDLRFDIRNALWPLGELEPILHHMQAAEPLAEALGDHRRLGWVVHYLSSYFWVTGDPERALACDQRAHALAATCGDAALQITAYIIRGISYHAMGDYGPAKDCLTQIVASLQGEQRRERLGSSALTWVVAGTWLVWCHADCGEFAEGRALGEDMIRIAEEADHPFSLTQAYWTLGALCLSQGDLQQAIPVLQRGLDLCQTWDVPLQLPWSASALGAAYALTGRITEALPLLEKALERAAVQGLMQDQARRVARLSEALLLSDRLAEAHTLAEQALELACAHKERGNQAYALRLLGDIAARRDPPESAPAEAHYRQALALAEELSMRPLVAHCHRDLGTLYAATEQRKQAHAELSAALALYREMAMTFWLPQTEAALAQVEE